MNNFNLIAPFYDVVKRLVFGRKLESAERYFTSQIKEGERVLIIGGGHGSVIEALPVNCSIDYLEFSTDMIRQAKERSKDRNVRFIRGDFLVTELKQRYDWVIASFFLDVFSEENLVLACERLFRLLPNHGHVIVTDFAKATNVHAKLLLWLMHMFFRIVAKLESKSIQPIRLRMEEAGFVVVRHHKFVGGKVFSAIFRKSGNL